MTTVRPPYPELRAPFQDSLLASDGSDNSARFTALLASLPKVGTENYGGEVVVAPGRYRFYSEVDISDIPSVKIRAQSGKHYQGTGTTVSPNTDGGVIFEGWTPGMTLFRTMRPSNPDATHQAPTFDGIGFQDGRSVASRQSITGVALASGTTYTYTTNATHSFIAGDSVYINGVLGPAEPFGTAFNGRFPVVAPVTGTTFSVNIGSNPSLIGLTFLSADVRYTPSMTLLSVEHQTRVRLRDCHFNGGLIGLNMGEVSGQNDVSWGNLYGCTFNMNDVGLNATGAQAQSISLQGGDFQMGQGQIGIDYVGSKAMFKAVDFKMDSLYNDGTGVIGVRLQGASNYKLDGSFEIDGPTIGIQAGITGNSYGRISCSMQGSHGGGRGSRVGTAIQITGTDAGGTSSNSESGEVSIMGTTFNGFGTAVKLDANTRGVKVIGGSVAFCDKGVDATGSQGTIVAFFTRRQTESGYVHITDGTDTKRIFCDDVTTPGGIVPAAGSTTQTNGFIHIPSAAGPPTGVPTLHTGRVPLYYDSTNHFLYIYDAGWKKTTVFA